MKEMNSDDNGAALRHVLGWAKMMKRAFPLVAAFGLALYGCQSAQENPTPMSIKGSVGKEVTLVGIAEPRKGGAALHGDDFYVWLKDIDFWPDEVVMKKVEVKGLLEEDHGLPVFIHDPNDPLVPQGIPMPEGTDLKEASRRLILTHPTWRSIE